MCKKKYWVILPASGIGSRMQASCPKQYLPFLMSTVIETTLKTLLDFKNVEGAVVVLNQHDHYWKDLNFNHDKPVYTTIGASERSGSVYCGLKKLSEMISTKHVMVMIHDAVRPCVTHEDLSKLVELCEKGEKAVFLAHPVTDTLKKSDSNGYSLTTVNRENLWRALTPQVFAFDVIQQAHQLVADEALEITDDVSAVEQLGIHAKILIGRSDNIKITFPDDLLVAQTVLERPNIED